MIDLPPRVAAGEQITLRDLEANTVTVPQNLTLECQRLYHNVAGPNITLEDDEFDFIAAIEESVNTPHKLAWELLKKKASGFGHEDFNGTYLRITLGRNMVSAQLLFLPLGYMTTRLLGRFSWHSIRSRNLACRSLQPHSRSRQFQCHHQGKRICQQNVSLGVYIRVISQVLHGTIHATYYQSLRNPVIIREMDFEEGEITWIDPTHYQIHKLHNRAAAGGAVCCTIQCYRFAAEDGVHFEGFNYIPEGETDSKPWPPNS